MNAPKREEVVSKMLKIQKAGKSFEVDCVIFEDKTFEISIYNSTQQEEEIRLKRQLTQNISHELKTPVSSIQGYMETILSMPNIDPAKRQLFLERCYAQSKRLSYLLSDISMLNRMDEANSMFDVEEVDVARIVRDIYNEIQLDLDKKNISVEFNNWPEKALIEGNSSLIYSIFRNLFDNAGIYAVRISGLRSVVIDRMPNTITLVLPILGLVWLKSISIAYLNVSTGR